MAGGRPAGTGGLEWVATLARPRPAPVPWAQAARSALAVGGPVAVGVLVGRFPLGVLAAFGGLPAAVSDRGGPYRVRALRVGLAVVGGALGFLVGGLAQGRGWVTVLVVTAVALLSGVLSALGATASGASLQLLVLTIVAAGRVFPTPVWEPPLLVLIGGSWALLLTVSGWPIRRSAPEREAVAGVYRAVADLLLKIGEPRAERDRRSLTDALNAAYDGLYSARLLSGGPEASFHRLIVALNAATPLVEAATALLHEGRRPPVEAARAVRALADAVSRGAPPPPAPSFEPGSPSLAVLASAMDRAIASVGAQDGGPRDAPDWRPPTLRGRALAAWERLTSGPAALLATVRLTLCIGVAEVVSELVAIERSYWVALTVAIVVKPDFGSVFARAVQRAGGTAIGVVIGAAVLAGLPRGAAIIPFVALWAGLLPIAIRRHYGIFSIVMTPLIIVLIGSLAGHVEDLVAARLIDTLIGCGIVLVLGYALWPETWHPRLGDRLAGAVDDVAAYLGRALGGEHEGRSTLRRRAYRRLSDLRTTLQQALAEPPPLSTRAAGWWPATVALERVTDAVTSAATHVAHGSFEPSAADLAMLEAALGDLAAVVREGRPPRALPLPDDPGLSGVATEIRTLRTMLAGASVEEDGERRRA